MAPHRANPQTNDQLCIAPLRIEDPCAALKRACRALSHFYDLVFSPLGLKASQFLILHAIYERTEIAQWRLADEYGISNDTLSRRLSVLRRQGLVVSRIGTERAGERVFRLTANGVQKVQQGLPYLRRAQDRFLQATGDPGHFQILLHQIDQICMAAQVAEHGRFANTVPAHARAAVAAPTP